jgi:hypothetical protein
MESPKNSGIAAGWCVIIAILVIALTAGAEKPATEPTNSAKTTLHNAKDNDATLTAEQCKKELDAAKRGKVAGRLKTTELRIDHGSKPPEYRFQTMLAKNTKIWRLEQAYAAADKRENPPIPVLHPWNLKSNTTGTTSWGVVVQKVLGPNEVLLHVRQDGSAYAYRTGQLDLRDPIDVVVRNFDTTDLADNKAFTLKGTFRVKGTEKVGSQTLFVLEKGD